MLITDLSVVYVYTECFFVLRFPGFTIIHSCDQIHVYSIEKKDQSTISTAFQNFQQIIAVIFDRMIYCAMF